MKHIIRIISLLFLCNSLWLFSAHAQGDYTPVMHTPMPASPTSRVFQKFFGYPISHATGTIDVQIPLYTLNVHDWSAPLTLKYHSSGVRVQDPVGIVGRNWALFPGFKISRTVMSKPDDIFPVRDNETEPSIDDLLRMSSPFNSCECQSTLGIDQNRMDGQYDIFQVNMPGMSSSFVLQRINGTDVVKQIPESPLKITPQLDNSTNFIRDHLYGFEIQDDKGIRYLFGESTPPRSAIANFLEMLPDGTSWCGWMLREIIFPGGDKISFTYQTVVETIPLFERTITVLDNGKWVGISGCYHDDMINSSTGSDSPYWRFLGSVGYKEIEGYGPPYTYNNASKVPASISAPNETISFSYNAQSMLQAIAVKQSNGTSIKQVQLQYDSGATNKLLKKVNMSGEGNYELFYKNEGVVQNCGFDWWGCYNGTPYHTTYLPTIELDVTISTGQYSKTEKMFVGHGANRDPNAGYMDTHSLIEIVSPTKGRLKINYEPHQFSVEGVSKIGEGIRVKSTELYDPISEKTIAKNYNYEDVHYLVHDYPDAKSLVSTGYICPLDFGSCMVRQRILSVFSHYANVSNSQNHIWYGKITETTSDWKKVYVYGFRPDEYYSPALDNHSPDYRLNTEYMLSHLNSILYPAPWLLSETSYRKNGTAYNRIQVLTNTYNSNENLLSGMVVVPYLFPFNSNSICHFMNKMPLCHSYPYYDLYGSPIREASYYISYGSHNLASTRKVTYAGNDSIAEEVIYTYDTARPYNVSQKTTLLSGGDRLVDKYYYSNNIIPDLSTLTLAEKNAVSSLTSRNYLTTPVQLTQEKNGRMLYSVLKGYTPLMTSAMVLQDEYYRKGDTGSLEKRMAYPRYDNYGNLIYVCKDDKEHVVYIWGYKGQYPVAEIKGVEYSRVVSALGCTPESLSSASAPSMSLIEGLRTKLPSSLVTTYTYSPGIGLTGSTAANGEKTTYEYDSYGRLSNVKDDSAKTTVRYDYYYQP